MAARIITLLVVLFLLARLRTRYRRGEIGLRRMLLWAVPWLGLGTVMLWPGLADRLATLLGLETATGVDLMAYVAVGVAFYLLFRLYVRLDRLERNLTAVTRELALRETGNDRADTGG